MNRIYKLFVAMFLAMFVSTSAIAGMDGLSIGVIGNIAEWDTSGSEQEGTGDKEKTTAAVSETHEYPTFFAEYTSPAAFNILAMTIGVEWLPGSYQLGAKSRTDTQNETEADSDDSGTYTAKAEASNHVSAYIEPTIKLHDNFAFFGKAGTARVTIESLESIALGADSSTYGNEGVWGLMWGGGIKYQHDAGIFVKLEYAHWDYETVTMQSSKGNLNIITAEPEAEAARLAIGYNF